MTKTKKALIGLGALAAVTTAFCLYLDAQVKKYTKLVADGEKRLAQSEMEYNQTYQSFSNTASVIANKPLTDTEVVAVLKALEKE